MSRSNAKEGFSFGVCRGIMKNENFIFSSVCCCVVFALFNLCVIASVSVALVLFRFAELNQVCLVSSFR